MSFRLALSAGMVYQGLPIVERLERIRAEGFCAEI